MSLRKPTYVWGSNSGRESGSWTPISKEEASGAKPPHWFDINANPGFIPEPFPTRMEFWEQLWSQHFNNSLVN